MGESKNRRNNTLNSKNMSKGEEIIGTFNVNENPDVRTIKESAIELINKIEVLGKDPRRKATAYTEIEKGVMMAVKSLFH